MEKINSFRGEYRFLSNFWPAPLWYGNFLWPTSEHAYQAAKTLDLDEQISIHEMAKTPGQAKRLGQRVTKRDDWEEIKLQKMFEIVKEKFWQNPDLMQKLLATGDAELIEGNTWGDTYWGQCNGVGENHLGKILMEIRDANNR